MARVSTNISLDADLKKQAQELFAEMGMDLSTAVSIFLRQTVRTRKIPFEISVATPNAETVEAIREVQEMRRDPAMGKTYDDVALMMKELLS